MPNGQGTPEEWEADAKRMRTRDAAALQARIRLRDEAHSGDVEADHGNADRVLCDLLVSLGYRDVVEDWLRVEKWYA